MQDHEAETDETTEAPTAEAGLANAVDDRASELTGAQGAESTDAPVADNRGAVANAEAHLDDTDLSDDRDALKKLQKDM